MPYRDLAGLRVLITGASQGIGRALVVEAVNRGCKVVAVARGKDLLDELVSELKGNCVPFVGDITNPADRAGMLDAAVKAYGGLDVLVNNAGIGATGQFVDNEPQTLRDIFEVNYFATCELTRAAIPILKSGRQPCVVNISSVLGRRSIPGRSLYSASKFALAGWSEALRAELLKDGIDVTVINPGVTNTNFPKNMLERKGKHQLGHAKGMTTQAVATKTWDAVTNGKYEITLTRDGKILVLLNRFAPRLVDFIATRRVAKAFASEKG
jgi:short-subunit dehydrogenase